MLNNLRTNPFRATDWRWQRACGIVTGHEPSASRSNDGPAGYAWIRRAARFRVALDGCDTELDKAEVARRYGAIFWAHWLRTREANDTLRYAVEAYILARQTNFQIGFTFGIPPEIVEAYEALFFDVREKLQHQGYILHCVIGRAISEGLSDRQYDLLWKLYGYFYGPDLLGGLISLCPNAIWCGTPDAIGAALQDDAIVTIKLKGALAAKTVSVNKYTQMPLLEMFTKFVEIERTTDSVGKAQGQILDHIEAMMTAMPLNVDGYNPTKGIDVDISATQTYDLGSTELTYQELTKVSLRQKLDNADQLRDLRFAEPAARIVAAVIPGGSPSENH